MIFCENCILEKYVLVKLKFKRKFMVIIKDLIIQDRNTLLCSLYMVFVFSPFIDEPDFGPAPVDNGNSCKASSKLDDITTKSAAIVVLTFLGVNSMQDVTVVKHLYPLAKKLTVKYRSLGKYQLSVKIAKALISQGYIEVKSPAAGGDINFLNLKRENIVCKKKDQLKSNDPDLDESDLDNGDTDSVTTDSSFSTQSDGFEVSSDLHF